MMICFEKCRILLVLFVTLLITISSHAEELSITCSDDTTYTFADVTKAGLEYCTSIPTACISNVGMNNTLLYTDLVHTKRMNSVPEGEVDKNINNAPTSTETFSEMKYEIGKVQAPLAIVIGNSKRPIAKVQYWLETDKFSLVELRNSTKVDIIDPENDLLAGDVEIRAEFANFTTPIVNRSQVSDDGKRYVVPYWNLNIELTQGVVTGLDWDNSCGDCTDRQCVKNQQCGVEYSKCVEHTDGLSCDIKVYVAWRGTDVHGKKLTSINSAMRNFRLFSIGFLFDYAARTANAIADKIPTTLPDLPDWNLF